MEKRGGRGDGHAPNKGGDHWKGRLQWIMAPQTQQALPWAFGFYWGVGGVVFCLKV